MPLLRDAGVTWLRYFPEWAQIQPQAGVWDWDWTDRFVAAAKANGIRIAGVFLGVVQGFERTCWFEATGPKYGQGVHAILGDDLSPFPAYDALAAMTRALGPAPQYAGWSALDGDCYGFVFESEDYRAPEAWYLDAGTDWQTHTWRFPDACFIQKWGWTFEVNAEMSAGDVWVREVRVQRLGDA